jgi:hypothetical protein
VTTILFSIIVIALSADLIVLTEPLATYPPFSAFALATGLLTVITIVPMYGGTFDRVPRITKWCLFSTHRFIIDMVRKGAFFSYIVVEIAWLSMYPCLAKFYRLTMTSGSLDSLVIERVLRRLDGCTTYRPVLRGVNLQLRCRRW